LISENKTLDKLFNQEEVLTHQINELRYQQQKLYQQIKNGDSYYTLVNNPIKKIYFNESNTPIENFCAKQIGDTAPCYDDNLIIINNNYVNVNNICSLSFGFSYGNVKTIDDY